MTPEAQRIAIAEACGWERVSLPGMLLQYRLWKHRDADGEDHKNWKTNSQLPDYLNDLNAMHEAEKVLTKKQWFNYVGRLHDLVMPDLGPDDAGVQAMIHATAAQRAEAFLRTIDKWQD